MTRNQKPEHSKGDQLPNRTMTSTEASATVMRLLEWKKHNDAKREVRARLQEDERLEEEEYFLSLPKTLSLCQVQAAALRNYHAASELRWKKLILQSVAERQQLDEEEAECTFRPKLVARHRCVSTTRTCRPSCATVTVNVTDQPRAPLGNKGRQATERNGDVFKRLSKPHTITPPVHVLQQERLARRISPQMETAFIERQERDQVNRQYRRSKLVARQCFSHKPKLSRHTQEICARLQGREGTCRTDQITDLRRRQRKQDSSKQLRYTIPIAPSDVSSEPRLAFAPFSSLIEALQQQEQRMRCISR